MGYWARGYWSSGYWAEGYWSDEPESPPGSTLFEDRVVTVVKFDLARKDGTGTDTFFVSEEFWAAGTLYAENETIFPVVAEPVPTPRSFDGSMGIRHDVQISLYGKSHFDRLGRGFFDLVQNYQIRNSTAEVLRFSKSPDGLGTPMGEGGIRHTLELTGTAWEPESGIMRVNARDTWYDDKEVSEKADPTLTGFEEMQEDRQFEYAAIPFGNGEGGDGVVIDAPYISTDASSGAAKLFCGFGDDGHPVDSVQKFYKKNKHKQIEDSEWVEVSFPGSSPEYGVDNFTDAGDLYARHLSLYSRGIVYTPSTTGKVLINVICQLKQTGTVWASDFSGANNLYRIGGNPFTFNEKSFSGCFWARFDTLQEQAILGKGNLSDGTAEWFVYMNSANKIAFGVSCDGLKNAAEAVWGSAASANTWYFVFFWYDAAARTVNVSVNDGTAVSVSTVVNSGTLTGGDNGDDTAKTFLQFAAGASGTDFTYNAFKTRITSGDALDDEKIVIYSTGSPKRGFYEGNWSPLPDTSDTYELIAFPSTKLGDEEKDGPFQVGYTGGITNHLDGLLGPTGIFREVVDPGVRTSIFNTGSGKRHADLTDAEKSVDEGFQLMSWWDMGDLRGERKDKQGSNHLADAGQVGSRPGKVASATTTDDGEIKVIVYPAVLLGETGKYVPDDSPLHTAKFDPEDIAILQPLGYPIYFPIDPIELVAGKPYFVVLEWSNHSDHAVSYLCNYRSSAGKSHYYKLQDGAATSGWTEQADVELAMALYVLEEAGGFDNAAAEPWNASYEVTAYHGGASGSLEFPEPTKDSEYKSSVRGLQDNGDGDFTGAASAVMENPSDLVRFTLLNDGLFLGIPAGDVDSDSLDDTRAALGDTHNMSFAIDRKTLGDPLIRKLNEQSDTVLVKSRVGKLTHHRETWHSFAFNHILSQARMRHELRILSVVETPIDRVYNDFLINFGVDELSIPKDPALIRRAGSDSFSASVYLNPTEASQVDAGRQARLAESQSRYGVLQYRADFDCYAADATGPLQVMNRLADRHCFQTLRVTISVPLKDFHAIDLFWKLSARHVNLPLDDGTSERVVWHEDGTLVQWHNAGVPLEWMRLGKLEGQVIRLVELDQDMEIVFETQNPF